ncbi:MAG: hypothetical protein ACI4F4_09450 [Lachnospiraceae bacterium]
MNKQLEILEDIGDMKLSTGSHVIGCPRFRIVFVNSISLLS